MEIGIIGLPMVGKTTLFNLLTHGREETSRFFSGRTDVHVGVARVPDRRLDFLSSLYRPRRTVYPQIQFIDVVGLVRGSSQGAGVGNRFLEAIRNADALLHVVRAFRSEEVPHVEDSLNPARDLSTVQTELLLADLELVEKRLEKISAKKKKDSAVEEEVLLRCREALEREVPLHTLKLSSEEEAYLRGYMLLTQKPMLLVANVDEEQWRQGEYPGKRELVDWAAAHSVPYLEVCGLLELEIDRLEPEDRRAFLQDLGLEETGIDRVARAAYRQLGLISFFTVGEDEVKAWQIPQGTPAREAAGKIHSDMARGFIRAEVVAYVDLERLGSMAKAREGGLLRLEGKEYVVQDGDIITFRFNV